jgi:hypothetical protein
MSAEGRWRSSSELMQALSAGILAADPFFPGYRPPPGFSSVLADFCEVIGETRIAMVLDDTVQQVIRTFVHSHPICLAWNRWGGADDATIKITSRYSRQPTEREFIDLDAIVQNAMVFLHEKDASMDAVDVATMRRIPTPD